MTPANPLLASPTVVFENDGTAHFRSIACGDLTTLGDDSRALVTFDYDRDGDQDVLVVNMRQPVRLFRNDTPRDRAHGHWIDISVRQRHGNRSGVGCRIEIHTDDGITQQQILLAGEKLSRGNASRAALRHRTPHLARVRAGDLGGRHGDDRGTCPG